MAEKVHTQFLFDIEPRLKEPTILVKHVSIEGVSRILRNKGSPADGPGRQNNMYKIEERRAAYEEKKDKNEKKGKQNERK